MKEIKVSVFWYFGKIYFTAYNNYHRQYQNKNLFTEIVGCDNLECAKQILENQMKYIVVIEK